MQKSSVILPPEWKKKETLILRIGMLVHVDNLGRIVIPKEYRDFYHINKNENVRLIDTAEGLLITNPKYVAVPIEFLENIQAKEK